MSSAVNAELAKMTLQVPPCARTCGCASSACARSPTPGKWSGTRSWIVVARRPALLRRVHPVGEVEHVEVAEPALGRRPAEPRPGRAPGVRADERLEPQLERDPGEHLGDRRGGRPARSARTRRRGRRPSRPPRRARAASRGCSCSRPSARARAGRRRRRSSRVVGEVQEVGAERPACRSRRARPSPGPGPPEREDGPRSGRSAPGASGDRSGSSACWPGSSLRPTTRPPTCAVTVCGRSKRPGSPCEVDRDRPPVQSNRW